MEEEAEKIKAMHSEVEKQMNLSATNIGKTTTFSLQRPFPRFICYPDI